MWVNQCEASDDKCILRFVMRWWAGHVSVAGEVSNVLDIRIFKLKPLITMRFMYFWRYWLGVVALLIFEAGRLNYTLISLEIKFRRQNKSYLSTSLMSVQWILISLCGTDIPECVWYHYLKRIYACYSQSQQLESLGEHRRVRELDPMSDSGKSQQGHSKSLTQKKSSLLPHNLQPPSSSPLPVIKKQSALMKMSYWSLPWNSNVLGR